LQGMGIIEDDGVEGMEMEMEMIRLHFFLQSALPRAFARC